MDALLLDFRAPGSLRSGYPRLCVCLRNYSGIFAQTDFRIPGDGGRNGLYWLRQHDRLGPSHVHDRYELHVQHVFCIDDDDYRRSDWHQDLQLAWRDVGREDSVHHGDALLPGIPVSVFDRRPYRHHARHRTFQLAAWQLLLRYCALPLCDRGRNHVLSFWGVLLLVSQSHWTDARRNSGQTAFLVVPHRVSPDV